MNISAKTVHAEKKLLLNRNLTDSDSATEWDDEELFDIQHEFKWFIELENIISTDYNQNFSEIFKKNELRGNINYKAGNDNCFLKLSANIYAIPYFVSKNINNHYLYSDNTRISRNFTISTSSFELMFNEFYFNAEFDFFNLRAGNQLINWGTADVFNPTSYFNPYDLREFLIRDEDEIRIPVPAFSSVITPGDDSIHIVIVPLHVSSLMAERDNFWAVKYMEGPFPVNLEEPASLDIQFKNFGFGIQYSSNFNGVDLNASYYHGPDREPAFVPVETLVFPNEPVSIIVTPQYNNINILGMSMSASVRKFIFQFEAAYSPDKAGVETQDYTQDLILPFSVKKTHFLSYSTGFNYIIPVGEWLSWHRGDLTFTTEWFQSLFFESGLMKPMLTDVLSSRLDDSFFDNRLKISFTAVVMFSVNGLILMPSAEYFFESGVSVFCSYANIKSDTGSYVGYYNRNDLLKLRVRYEI